MIDDYVHGDSEVATGAGAGSGRTWTIAAIVYSGSLLILVPLTPILWRAVLPLLQPHVTLWFAGFGAALATPIAISILRSEARRHPAPWSVLAGVAAAYGGILRIYMADASPANKLHVLLYGTLAWLVLEGLRPGGWRSRAGLGAMAWVLGLGLFEECLQAVVPGRYFDPVDIAGNWVGGVLGATAWIAASPSSPWRPGVGEEKTR